MKIFYFLNKIRLAKKSTVNSRTEARFQRCEKGSQNTVYERMVVWENVTNKSFVFQLFYTLSPSNFKLNEYF
jgi:hypothetical protein